MTNSRLGTEELAVLGAMLKDPIAWHYSLGIGAQAGVAPGTMYPLVAKLEKAGWLESRWEGESAENTRRRRLYRLTGVGQRCATAVFAGGSAGSPGSRRRRRLGFGLPQPQRACF